MLYGVTMWVMSTTHDPEWSLGERLRKARLEAEMDQGELAARTGLSRRTIVNWENNHKKPPRYGLIIWSATTGVPYRWLVDDPEAPDDPLDLLMSHSPCIATTAMLAVA